jgi:hypothetical protein
LQRVLTTVTLLGLLVATAAAFVITEHLKLKKLPLAGTQVSKVLSPTCHCATGKATVQIRLRERDHVTVTIVNSGGDKVATIAAHVLVQRKQPRAFTWYGRTAGGAVAPDGAYHPWVALANARHTYKLLNTIVVDTKPPRVLSARAGKPVFFARPGRTIAIRYSFSEPAHAVVYLGHRRVVVGRPTRPEGRVKWAATVPAGTYTLSVAARDVAGNETPAAQRKRFRVVVHEIEVTPKRLEVRAGKRFTVAVRTATAQRYTWRLARQHGSRNAKLLHLRAPTTPGLYHLVVMAQRDTASVAVRVRAK